MDRNEGVKNLASAYDRRMFDKAPEIYRDLSFLQQIHTAASLEESKGKDVLDLMSGPAKLSADLEKMTPGQNWTCLDLVHGQLKKISFEGAKGIVQADAKKIPLAPESFDRVVVRFGIKDIEEKDQKNIIDEVYRVLRHGGILVVADMVAPKDDEGKVKSWLNQQHELKQELGGRNKSIEGVCHIPTEDEWLSLLRGVGFQTEIEGMAWSHVNTQDWVKSKQVTTEQLKQLDEMIVSAPEEIRRIFDIKKEEDGVKINYPLIVLKAIKN